MPSLDIGCGANKQAGCIGLDIAPLPGVDVVHDLDKYPYPFEDNTFDTIYCYSVLEHVDRVMQTMAELHRILKPGGKIEIGLPHYSHPKTYGDPTHRHFYSFRVVEYLSGRAYPYYGNVRFNIDLAVLGQPGRSTWVRRLVNRWPYVAERLLAPVRPIESMYFILTAVK